MSWAEIVLKALSVTSRRMESRAEHPILYLLIVNHDARFREKSHKAVFNAEFDSCVAAIVRTSCAPQIKRGTVSLELTNVLNDAHYGNPGCAGGSHQRVVHINVNNHDSEVAGSVGERSKLGDPTQQLQPRRSRRLRGSAWLGLHLSYFSSSGVWGQPQSNQS